jgi:hypothetical protein
MSSIVTPPLLVASAGNSVVNNTPPAKVLVLGCIDPRFASYLSWFLTHYRDVYGKFDLFTLAGASLGVNQSSDVGGPSAGPEFGGPVYGNYNNVGNPIFLHWDSVFTAHLDLALTLHQITDVWIFDHLDCGAYKIIKFGSLSSSDDVIPPHTYEIARLAESIDDFIALRTPTTPALNIKGFVINTSGNIFKVYDNERGGLDVLQSSTSSSGVWLWPTLVGLLVLILIFFQFQARKKL